MKTVEVTKVVGSRLDLEGTRWVAFYAADGKAYFTCLADGNERIVKPGATIIPVDEVKRSRTGLVDFTFIFNKD